MLCTNCGKDIPFTGRVCPYCRVDKSGDQLTTIVVGGFGTFGFAIGYAVDGILTGFAVGVCGMVVGLIFLAVSSHSKKNPAPKYYLDSERKSSDPNAGARLEFLKSLKDSGYISDEKFNQIK